MECVIKCETLVLMVDAIVILKLTYLTTEAGYVNYVRMFLINCSKLARVNIKYSSLTLKVQCSRFLFLTIKTSSSHVKV